jgi:hypothetical protein
MARCPKCGAKLYLKYKVCLSCGAKIDFVNLRKKFEVARRKRILWLILLSFVLMILTIVLAILVPELRSLLTVILATLFMIFAFAIILFIMYFYYIYR